MLLGVAPTSQEKFIIMIVCIEGPSQGLFTSIHITLVVDPGEAPQLIKCPESVLL